MSRLVKVLTGLWIAAVAVSLVGCSEESKSGETTVAKVGDQFETLPAFDQLSDDDADTYIATYHYCEDRAIAGVPVSVADVVDESNRLRHDSGAAARLGCLDGIAGLPLEGSGVVPK